MSTPHAERNLREFDLCFVDVETTGAVFGYHEIIEIGAVRTTPGGAETKGTWSTRIRPRFPERISPAAQKVNGFTEEQWRTAPESSTAIWSEFVDFASGCIPVAHNPSFDRAFVTLAAAAVEVVDLNLDFHWIGTETLAWPLYLSGKLTKMSLPALCELFGIPPEPEPHQAINGAMTCQKVYCELMKPYGTWSGGM